MDRHTRRTKFGALLVGLASLLVIFGGVALVRSDPAAGDVTNVAGGAFGELVDLTTLLGATVKSGPAPSVELPPGGGGPVTDSLASLDIPGVLSLRLLEVSTQGSPGPAGSVQSSATVADVSIANGAVIAQLIRSDCTADSAGARGTTTLTSISVAGVPIATVTPPANTAVDVPGVGTLILNEQILSTSDGTSAITVNAVHLRQNGVAGTGDLILSQSRCAASGSNVVVPVGALGALSLALVIGALFLWRLSRGHARTGQLPTPAS